MTNPRNRVRILFNTQALRLRKNPLAVILLGLLITIAMLVSLSTRRHAATVAAEPAQTFCWIVFSEPCEWMEHLRQREPDKAAYRVVAIDRLPQPSGPGSYPHRDAVIQVDSVDPPQIRYRPAHGATDVPAESARWFWVRSTEFFGGLPVVEEAWDAPPLAGRGPAGSQGLESTKLSDLMTPRMVATLLLYGTLFFCCCHLLVSFSSQDRERGTLLALALSPASLKQLLAARFAFHALLALGTSLLIVAILRPFALINPLLWLVLILTGLGFLAVGTLIAAAARTQGTAGLLTLSYMLLGAVVFYLSGRFSAFGVFRSLSFEHYSFLLTYAGLTGAALTGPLFGMFVRMLVLVAVWVTAAVFTFRRIGWQ